ncbi:MAG: DUF374 domain-containing protein [Rhizobacter sp.]|nr:DUF374 domain-containing protein [Chlorobiales bacterium]
MRLLYRTLRVQVHVASAEGEAENMAIEALRSDLRRGFLFAFWHGTMLTGWLFARQFSAQLSKTKSKTESSPSPGGSPPGSRRLALRPLRAVVSLSKDGVLLSGALHRLGFGLIRGSSSKGREEVKAAIDEALRLGHAVAITPDGPRGPREVFKYGSIRLASETGRMVVFARITHHRKWQLKSWDKFEIPKPFSRVEITLSLVAVPTFSGDALLKNFTDVLTARFSNGDPAETLQASSAIQTTSA